ncbi:hypothetical protein TRFO_23702 [Tritrichomonas foetus]|uniref:TPR Domain containing protein n=1 Tax=Tritrichomonas foetus TaxID=1144522 RepID=A0A1J4K920_9EUKA|nr:hypothetical protein TRFO_23702 [Tritrichomonas foetus]|eukprot:OHT07993.1 hypothetical protein TRFO_23702 [Tritrichomonas foetus]
MSSDNTHPVQNLLRLLQRLESSDNYESPGDNDYPNYQVPCSIASERAFLNDGGPVEDYVVRAFTIANKAKVAIEKNDIRQAERMGYHAITIDPDCVDGWRIFSTTLYPLCDGDTVICAIREVIKFARSKYRKTYVGDQGTIYSICCSRPYVRILMDLASIAANSEQFDVVIYACEEGLRLNYRDNKSARNLLLFCYLKLLGRGMKYPMHVKPHRTVDHIHELINDFLKEDPLFENANLVVRWSEILLAYYTENHLNKQPDAGKDWRSLVTAENNKNDVIFKVVFGELDVNNIPPSCLEYPLSYESGNKNDDCIHFGNDLKECLRDWPSFLIDLWRYMRGSVPKSFIHDVESSAPNPQRELTPEYKAHKQAVGENYLQKGRIELENGKFVAALRSFSFSKFMYFKAAQPSRRWYLNTPFAVVSNRATCAYLLRMWNLARIDSRYTLVMKPDHIQTYKRLPKFAEVYKARQLQSEFEAIAKDVASNHEKKKENEWQEMAKTVIGLLSITALTLAAKNKLKQKARDQAIAVGIEDMYTPVNIDWDIPHMSWLNKENMETYVE